MLVLFLIAALIPVLGSRYYTFLATDIIIFAMFATSLNLLLGYTGLVLVRTRGLLRRRRLRLRDLHEGPGSAVPGRRGCSAASAARLFAAVFGFFCVRLTSVYFSMLTMAFAQIVWAICFKWNDVTGGEQGYPNVPMPSMAWLDWIPLDRRPEDRPQVLLPDADPGGPVASPPCAASCIRRSAACSPPSATIPSARSSSASMCASIS